LRDEVSTMKSKSNMTRRGFLKGASLGAVGAISAGPSEAQLPVSPDVFATPRTIERRNGVPFRAFGRTGERVSLLGVGGFHIGVPEETEGIRIVRTAIDEGLNFMDNAWEYNGGESERRMGKALRDGYRQKAFLMTKGCARDAKGAMAQLEDSLRRFQTDVIDLWQFHECNYDNDPDLLFAKDGAIHAAVRAKEQGKIRFIGFTGHKSPHIHLKMLAHDFQWDALQMPLNLCDAHYRSFTRQVLPLAIERGIAVIGMKTQAGGVIPQKAPVSVQECLRYSMSLNVPVCLSGMRSLLEVRENIGFVKRFEPLSATERESLLTKVEPLAAAGALERFKSTQRYDSEYHQRQHGFL
jgi:predicted aldo/keto reductase-like oxidoreductase